MSYKYTCSFCSFSGASSTDLNIHILNGHTFSKRINVEGVSLYYFSSTDELELFVDIAKKVSNIEIPYTESGWYAIYGDFKFGIQLRKFRSLGDLKLDLLHEIKVKELDLLHEIEVKEDELEVFREKKYKIIDKVFSAVGQKNNSLTRA
jgi:hypothetical protein